MTPKKAGREPKNYIGEWYGHRLYPTVKCRAEDVVDLRKKRCPFLSSITRTTRQCVKSASSAGVCTITTTQGGVRDWMVCPYRAADPAFLNQAVARLFGVAPDRLTLYPAACLREREVPRQMTRELRSGKHVFIFFQDKLGGEINVSGTPRSPEFSFDITILPVRFEGGTLCLNRFAVLEVQTMDFHGSYRQAVSALDNAVDLHDDRFPEVLAKNMEWLGRGIEGPNIANVFKRTFYQIALKFSLAGKGACVGAALALPVSVWESWLPHLGRPVLVKRDDCYVLKNAARRKPEPTWIILFSANHDVACSCEPIVVDRVIQASADALLKCAYEDVPRFIAQGVFPDVKSRILTRVRTFYANVRYE